MIFGDENTSLSITKRAKRGNAEEYFLIFSYKIVEISQTFSDSCPQDVELLGMSFQKTEQKP